MLKEAPLATPRISCVASGGVRLLEKMIAGHLILHNMIG